MVYHQGEFKEILLATTFRHLKEVATGKLRTLRNGELSYLGVVYLLYMLYFKMSCVYCCHLMCICCTMCVLLFFTLDAGLLARSQYSEGPATGHLDTGFSWFPCVYK